MHSDDTTEVTEISVHTDAPAAPEGWMTIREIANKLGLPVPLPPHLQPKGLHPYRSRAGQMVRYHLPPREVARITSLVQPHSNLERLAAERDLTRTELAARAHLSPEVVNAVWHGHADAVSDDYYVILASVLHVPVNALFDAPSTGSTGNTH
jgi:hypothetical protein